MAFENFNDVLPMFSLSLGEIKTREMGDEEGPGCFCFEVKFRDKTYCLQVFF